MAGPERLRELNVRTRHVKDLSGWRKLFLEVIERLQAKAVLDLGCGKPAFLARLPVDTRRVGVDGNPEYAPQFEQAGIEFHACDLNLAELPIPLEGFDVAVCSDVFEHLLFPLQTLGHLASALNDDGVLLSHVPNEFRFDRTLDAMLGRRNAVYFHHDCEEWTNPHVRRFTDLGFRAFLAERFAHSVLLTDLNPPKGARRLNRWRLPVPYCFQGGPTYASTNSDLVRDRLLEIRETLRQARGLPRPRAMPRRLAPPG